MRVLNALTTKCRVILSPVSSTPDAFQVVSPHCFTTIDHDNLGENKIFLTWNASDYRTGIAWPSWEEAKPVAFDSTSLRDAAVARHLVGRRTLDRAGTRSKQGKEGADSTQDVIAAVSESTLGCSLALDILTGYTEDPFCRSFLLPLIPSQEWQRKTDCYISRIVSQCLVFAHCGRNPSRLRMTQRGNSAPTRLMPPCEGPSIGRTCAGILQKGTFLHVLHACATSRGQPRRAPCTPCRF